MRPKGSRGGMYVRVKKWREDAQPNRSDAEDVTVSGTQQLPGVTPGGTGPVPRQRHAGAPVRPGRSGGRGAHAQSRPSGTGAPGSTAITGSAAANAATGSARSAGPTGAVGAAGSTGSAGTFSGGPWENAAEFGHTHDPHEVTVQLDGVGRQVEELLVRQAKEGADAGAGDGPVFVDETGRRSRRYRRIGMVVGTACAVYAVVIVATLLSGNSDAPWLPVPGQADEQPAGKVDTSPLPAESVLPSDAAGVTPAPGASVSAGVTPSRGAAAAVTPDASASASQNPGPSVSARPSASVGKPDPGTSTPGPDPEPSVSVSNSPAPSPSESVATSPDPTPTPTGDGGTVAGGPSDPTPIAEGAAEPSATGDPVSPPTSPGVTA